MLPFAFSFAYFGVSTNFFAFFFVNSKILSTFAPAYGVKAILPNFFICSNSSSNCDLEIGQERFYNYFGVVLYVQASCLVVEVVADLSWKQRSALFYALTFPFRLRNKHY